MRRAFGLLAMLAGIAALALAGWWWVSRPTAPTAFYDAPEDAPPVPGVLLRSAPFATGLPAGALGWTILYTTTRENGAAAAASAIVVAAADALPSPRPVVAWTHGTTGIVPGCAPSLLAEPFANVPALAALLARGWVYVATDYVGLGTRGPHPYLIGEGAARSALDSVRAARQLEALRLDDRTVVWGHSQGGHAALWAGIIAPAYAPDVPLAGVAALAPASDLAALVEAAQATPVGKIMSSFIVGAYAAAYPEDLSFDAVVRAAARPLARDMAGRCLAGREAMLSVAEALLLDASIFAAPPASGAFGRRLAQNTPDRPIGAPLLVAQGDADDLVLPRVQAAFVARRCTAGQRLEYRTYGGRNHLSLVGADSPLTADLLDWTAARFAGVPQAPGCTTTAR